MPDVLATAIREEEEINGIQIEKKEVKLSLFVDGMILYVENPKDSTKNLLDPISEFTKVAGNNINIQKSVLYMNNELLERETKKTIPLTVASDKIKYLEINSTTDIKDMNSENDKKLIQISGSI